ncbi:hypothetical protein Misp01_44880 [Microtetraspora sp. NBRC 13810]|nr:hypothetical protein Misp01_44880 [Microtetraspora sp. NBRC 13810]
MGSRRQPHSSAANVRIDPNVWGMTETYDLDRDGDIDMSEEHARHLGHAHALRESVDGLVGENPARPR